MIRRLKVVRFKSLRNIEVEFGPLTVLIGANASGKTNLLDVIRFLQGVGNGLTAREVLDGRPADATYRRWPGIRGGSLEVLYRVGGGGAVEPDGPQPWGAPDCFGIEATIRQQEREWRYRIVVDPEKGVVRQEDLYPASGEKRDLLAALADVQFLDISPPELKKYNPVGVERIGDRGENFASVVHAIQQRPERNETFLAWLQELTPTRIEAVDLFWSELDDVLFGLRENGLRLSARSLSDGTLRFAALAAALFGPQPPGVLLIEEIENGVHPTRLRLLLEMLQQATQHGPQVIVTTHSPLVLAYLPPELYPHVLFVYRAEDGDSRIVPLSQVPHLLEVAERRPVDELFATGWLEAAV